MIKKKIFESNHLEYYSEDDLYNNLKECWGYNSEQPIIVYGTIAKDKNFIVEIHSLLGERVFNYPQIDRNDNIPCKILVRDLNLPPKNEGFILECTTKIASKNDRDRYKSPFLLEAVKINILHSVPDELISTISVNNKNFIRDWIYKNLDKEQFNKLNEEITLLESEVNSLAESKKELLLEKENILADTANINFLLAALQAEITEKESEMAMLSKKLEDITEKLQLLGLVDSELLPSKKEDLRIGLSLEDVGNTPQKIVSYIQSYMNNKGIKYRRKVLEDFYALLSSYDLIILAGDSGTGKTNLVKSFADAIGGKAIIIPVKPNWTSAEDLLGYYNPIEHRFITTPFLDALIEAKNNPTVPYFICLDEMNLARVEYYFADFLSLLENRESFPKIPILTSVEGSTIESEVKNFLSIIDKAQEFFSVDKELSFIEIMHNEKLNDKLHSLCGFKQGDSLLKYHAYLRKLLMTYSQIDEEIEISPNIRFIGAINVDETTHYLSPKILDRAHIIRFENPLLMDFQDVNNEIEEFENVSLESPLLFTSSNFQERKPYPRFDAEDELVLFLLKMVREYLDPLGIEFSYRTIGQACLYRDLIKEYKFDNFTDEIIKNNIILHKVLPKFVFDAQKKVNDLPKKDKVYALKNFLSESFTETLPSEGSCIKELDRIIMNAENNDWIVNYWAK